MEIIGGRAKDRTDTKKPDMRGGGSETRKTREQVDRHQMTLDVEWQIAW